MVMATILSYQGKVPKIHESVYVAPTATIIGDVEIGEGSSIWFGAVLRGDVMPIRIGKEVSVQDNAVVHVTGGMSSTVVGDRVTVGHTAILHGCIVGNDCLIGMGAVVLDNARIADGCIVGASSLVTMGSTFEASQMILGSPAKPRRPIKPQERTMIELSAQHYVELSHTYLEEKGTSTVK